MCKVMVLFKAVVLQVGSVFYSSLFDKVTYNTGQPASAGWPVYYIWDRLVRLTSSPCR